MHRLRATLAWLRPNAAGIVLLAVWLASFVGVFYSNLIRGEPVPVLLAQLVIVFCVPLNWYVVYELARLRADDPDNRLLRDRWLVAAMLAIVVTIFALVFVNNGLIPPPLEPPQTMVLTRLAILSLVIPPLYWLSLYRKSNRGGSHVKK